VALVVEAGADGFDRAREDSVVRGFGVVVQREFDGRNDELDGGGLAGRDCGRRRESGGVVGGQRLNGKRVVPRPLHGCCATRPARGGGWLELEGRIRILRRG
jgi:hypothetical protein